MDMLQKNDINDVLNEWRTSQMDEAEALKHVDDKQRHVIQVRNG